MINCEFENGNRASLRHVTVNCIVVKEGSILLAKRSEGLLESGKWCLLGGYMNRDETTAQAGIRETREESGWQVDNLQLFRIIDHPNRPHEDRQNVEFIYIAEAIEEVGQKDWESEQLHWFALDQLPEPEQIAFDHGDSICLYKQHLASTMQLPILAV